MDYHSSSRPRATCAWESSSPSNPIYTLGVTRKRAGQLTGPFHFCRVSAWSLAVGVVLYVDGLIHRGGGGVCFFVGGDVGFVLQAGADVVDAASLRWQFTSALANS